MDPRGSSPLTRGKRAGRSCWDARRGLIPAHAGKTRRGSRRIADARAHPRSRGENVGANGEINEPRGSSPLTRGKPCARRKTASLVGLIPAHAGKTDVTVEDASHKGAHPRSRGENLKKAPATFSPRGSSPLTRGKHRWIAHAGNLVGLIPAHAGKTLRAAISSLRQKAHPRSRGENTGCPQTMHGSPGSSPLTRGKPGGSGSPMRTAGLIPAHAGKTDMPKYKPTYMTAHPRSRGENSTMVSSVAVSRGSSPLTRGKREINEPRFRYSVAHPRSRGENSHHARGRWNVPGLIPAHAGKTCVLQLPMRSARAHPRSRGENASSVLYG